MTMDIFLGEEIDSNDGDSLANETPGIEVLPDICNLSYLQLIIIIMIIIDQGAIMVILLLNSGCASSQPSQLGGRDPFFGERPYN